MASIVGMIVLSSCGDNNKKISTNKKLVRNNETISLVSLGVGIFSDTTKKLVFSLYNSTLSYYTDTGMYSDVDPVYTGPTVYSFQFNNSTPYSGTIIVEPEIWPLSIGEPKKDTLVFTEYQF